MRCDCLTLFVFRASFFKLVDIAAGRDGALYVGDYNLIRRLYQGEVNTVFELQSVFVLLCFVVVTCMAMGFILCFLCVFRVAQRRRAI